MKLPSPSARKLTHRQAAIYARFTSKQAAALWALLDSTMLAREQDGDKRDASRWRRMRDKFALPAICTYQTPPG